MAENDETLDYSQTIEWTDAGARMEAGTDLIVLGVMGLAPHDTLLEGLMDELPEARWTSTVLGGVGPNITAAFFPRACWMKVFAALDAAGFTGGRANEVGDLLVFFLPRPETNQVDGEMDCNYRLALGVFDHAAHCPGHHN